MLREFSVENFRSINGMITLSLDAVNAIKDLDGQGYGEILNNKILNCLVFYGANSCGKSNIFKAISRMRKIVCYSIRLNEGDPLPYDPFMFSDKIEWPTTFSVKFTVNNTFYSYGFSYNNHCIVKEWLSVKYQKRSEKLLFNRKDGKILSVDENIFPEGVEIKRSLDSGDGKIKLNSNRLLISLAGQLGGEVSNIVIKWFSASLHVISGYNDFDYSDFTKKMLHRDESMRNKIVPFLMNLNLGFNDIKTESVSVESLKFPASLPRELIDKLKQVQGEEIIKVRSIHNVYSRDGQRIRGIECDFEETESLGTVKIFNLAGPIMETINNGGTLCIDELDSGLHPLLTKNIISYFNNRETNCNNAQLLVTSHDTGLMNRRIFRRDQICLVEKDARDATRVEKLFEVNVEGINHKARPDSNYEKNYLEGNYGAVPKISLFEELNGQCVGALEK